VTAGVAYLGFIETDLAADAFAQAQVAQARKAAPAFFTNPMPAEAAAHAVVDGIERRAARVGAPAWVLPMLAVRGAVTTVMDEVMIHNADLSRAISSAESEAAARPRLAQQRRAVG
jgi:hypothetical protein